MKKTSQATFWPNDNERLYPETFCLSSDNVWWFAETHNIAQAYQTMTYR